MAEPRQGVNQERPKKRGHYMTYLSNSGDPSTCKIPKSTRRRWEKLKEQRQTSKNFEPTSRIDGKVKEDLLDPAADIDLDITLILFERSNDRFETFAATDQDHSQNTNLTFNRLFFA